MKSQAAARSVDVDQLLQDSYLLVVELRHGASAPDSDALWAVCTRQVVEVRDALTQAGVSQRNVDLISHAQCALMDETVLIHADAAARAKWTHEPLQAHYFGRHQAGQFLYEEMREVLHEPSPDPSVLRVYHRVLMLGFLGRYKEPNHPKRQQLMAELTARVAPLTLDQALPTWIDARGRKPLPAWLRAPLLHLLAAGLLLAGIWWLLDSHLAALVASLVTERM
uniref:DotU family type IV/VI secretion system protein n=1 Tax=Pseudomonas graminis TaxID=158627 RepID=A0A7C1WT49_9PSED